MSARIWLWHIPGGSEIVFEGHREFRDVQPAVPGKDEWGIDTLDRQLRGPGSDFEEFCATLKQGTVYKTAQGQLFYLQSWRPIAHELFPGAAITYKGLTEGQLPEPLPQTTQVELMSSLSADNLSVSFNNKTIISATQERKYLTQQTTYRYFTNGEPEGPRFTKPTDVRGTGIVVLDTRAMVTYSDGSTQPFTGSLPAGVSTALFSTPFLFNPGPNFFPIVGTPWYEVEETVCNKYR